MTTIAQFVKSARTSVGISQSQLADLANKTFGKNTITRGHISRVEQGLVGLSVDKMNVITTVLFDLGA